jgi:hypothetical protein
MCTSGAGGEAPQFSRATSGARNSLNTGGEDLRIIEGLHKNAPG